MERIKLMLVDDHAMIRQGMKSLFESIESIDVVAEAGNGHQALDVLTRITPDVILMDVTMPIMDGIEATRRISIAHPKIKVLALTVHEDRQFFKKMILAGASGYVPKRALADDVIRAIEIVMKGGVYLSPGFARILVEEYMFFSNNHGLDAMGRKEVVPEVTQKLNLMSDREKQVAALVAEGLTSQEIGTQLGITTATVSRHRARLMERLEIDSIAGLVLFAIRSRLIEI